MAFFSLHAYDADVWIPEFKGIDQSDVNLNPDLRYAAEALNVETPNGVLQPMAYHDEAERGSVFPEDATGDIETLVLFTRRWYAGAGSNQWYICARGGKFYEKQAGTSQPWGEITLPGAFPDGFANNKWSWVTYEINPEPAPGEDPVTLDVLLISNADDGMIMIIPPDRPTTWGDIKEQNWSYYTGFNWEDLISQNWTMQTVDCRGKKFGSIERFNDRVFGTAINDEPDKVYYSAVYKATDWREYTPNPNPLDPYQTEGQPEEGSGDNSLPTWDGDRFYGLKRFGDQLLIFKQNHIWTILNTNPGEYIFKEQFGEGTKYMRTAVVHEERVLMMTDKGIAVYDGMNTTMIVKDQIKGIWKYADTAKFDGMCAEVIDDKYYVSFPNKTTHTNETLVYDLKTGTILYYDVGATCFVKTLDRLIYAEHDSQILRVINNDSWNIGKAYMGNKKKWVSPWIDFGYKRIQKGGFDLYFIPEVKDNEVTLDISIQTEKKTKTKSYTIQPLTDEQRAAQREHRGKRLHFGGTGRKFRIVIETLSSYPWRLIGGIQLVVETDPD